MKNKSDGDGWYKFLKGRYLIASKIIHDLAEQQAVDRVLLQIATSDLQAKEIRHRLARRRCGQNGLRKLNKDIARFYRYCEEKGY